MAVLMDRISLTSSGTIILRHSPNFQIQTGNSSAYKETRGKSSPKSADVIFEVSSPDFSISIKDPDFNKIENLFNVIKLKVAKGGMKKNIFRKTFDAFSITVEITLDSTFLVCGLH